MWNCIKYFDERISNSASTYSTTLSKTDNAAVCFAPMGKKPEKNRFLILGLIPLEVALRYFIIFLLLAWERKTIQTQGKASVYEP